MNASQNFVTLQMSGPGYSARGCQGDRRYRMMEIPSVAQYVRNVLAVAIKIEEKCCTISPVRAAGRPSRRRARWIGSCVSVRLNTACVS